MLIGLVICLSVSSALNAADDSETYESESGEASFTEEDITVYKHRFCFCCKDWIEHLQHAGMSPAVVNRGDMGVIKSQWAIPQGFGSCHTAVWRDRYVFEGHVPARIIRKFLANPPEDAIGLSVPGMPEGSPGMYDGGEFEPYNVYLLLPGGDYRFYARITRAEDGESSESPKHSSSE
ncbi:hypothetical protein AVO43_03605 [Microbulbifer sp. ZGT114]|nr:hypothetical protein AVO43_03605 [Microbulbifer sp. ZGT114]